jgi:ribose 5-phosphate isomerase B
VNGTRNVATANRVCGEGARGIARKRLLHETDEYRFDERSRGMRVAVGADASGPLTDALVAELRKRGAGLALYGALDDGSDEWASIGRAVAETVRTGRADVGVVCCWTGTGISIAANKVDGVRAALCADAVTARGARRWNDANVLALSMRATTPAVGLEILDAFLGTATTTDPAERREIEKLGI